MPLSINVGLSRKASKDYQSTGYSINVTSELDQSLLARPEELQKQIADLYAQAGDALDRQAGSTPAAATKAGDRPPTGNGYRGRNGNGYPRNGTGRTGGGRATGGDGEMTASQRRAIMAITERLGINAEQEAVDIAGTELDALTLRQASEFIDHLRNLQTAGNGQTNGQ
jgi:hypothetical protein